MSQMPRYPSKRLTEAIHRETASGFYSDKATYYAEPSSTQNLDDAGQATATVQGTEIECAFSDNIRNRQSIENWMSEADVQQIDAEIRFGGGVIVPTKGGKFALTQKWDNPNFNDFMYEVVGIRDRGALGYMCALKRVTV
jgi:hypothetical protein